MILLSIVLCAFGGFQGLVLIFGLKTIGKRHSKKFDALIAFVFVASVTLIGRSLYLFPETVDPRVPILSDLVLFLFGPLLFIFIRSSLENPVTFRKGLIHFVPALLHLLATIPLFLMERIDYDTWSGKQSWMIYFYVILFAALIHNCLYLWGSFKYVSDYKGQFLGSQVKLSAAYVDFVLWMFALILFVFAGSIVLYFVHFQAAGITYQLAWILASWMFYGVSYYVIVNPESFGNGFVKVQRPITTNRKEQEQITALAIKLRVSLEEKRVFLDQEISLSTLSKMLGTNSVLLSKTINQKFEMSFYDLINSYRVTEFIRLADDSKNGHFTFFALALRAGFSSKTSFNKYFKKFTGLNPKNYFRRLTVA